MNECHGKGRQVVSLYALVIFMCENCFIEQDL